MSGHRLVAIFALAALTSAAATAGGQSGSARADRPSVSVICLYSIVASLAEAGRECRAGQNPEMQAELERAERRLDEHILANSEFTSAQIERFKAEQRRPSNQDLCQMVGPPYDGFAAVGPERFRSDLDWILANRRSIAEGDCL